MVRIDHRRGEAAGKKAPKRTKTLPQKPHKNQS